MDDNPNPKRQINGKFGVGLVIGIGIGIAIGVGTDNLPVWIAVGVAIGAALGVGLQQREPRKEDAEDGD